MITVDEANKYLQEGQLIDGDQADSLLKEFQEQGGADSGEAWVDWLAQRQVIPVMVAQAIKDGVSGPYCLGPYEIHENIYTSRSGNVFRARHVDFDQMLALKVFPPEIKDDPEKVGRLGREARVAISVNHPNVVRTLQVGRFNEIHFLALEELKGETLTSKLAREKTLAIPDACKLISQVAQGLESLHQHDVVHGNIQPDTIWITEDGSAKIMDFSAAHDALDYLDEIEDEPDLMVENSHVIGNYNYLSAEQGLRQATPQSDIYSLGCVFFHCLVGDPPFKDKNPMRKMLRHALDPIPKVTERRHEVPVPVQDVVESMMSKSPRDRYAHARYVTQALKQHIPSDEQYTDVTGIKDDFLKWVQSPEGAQVTGEHNARVDPKVLEFMDWLTEKNLLEGTSSR